MGDAPLGIPLSFNISRIFTMTQRIIQTDDAPAPVGPYNQAILATGSLLFASGQIALDATTGILIAPEDVEA
ncbi:MAG: Rid family hydrolase, partial [Prochlorothrix sp.]